MVLGFQVSDVSDAFNDESTMSGLVQFSTSQCHCFTGPRVCLLFDGGQHSFSDAMLVLPGSFTSRSV